MDNGQSTRKELADDPTVIACVVFQTRDPEQLVQLLREALTGIRDQAPSDSAASPTVPLQTASTDVWLKHPEAAEFIGISKSTLYRYACQQKIECRKLAGRLEYRRSVLERFKDLQTRPAKKWFPTRSIILPALGSGK
jgi:hypothetical protein